MAGENYIGSKISLISLSDIRYVGILHSINAQDSTVGLKQVRSFGTEGRRGKPDEEIFPSDNVFDYVVFRGSDIKDLQVFEAPPPTNQLPPDPAIMSMGPPPPVYPPYIQPTTSQEEQVEKEALKSEQVDTDEQAVDQLVKKVSEINTADEETSKEEERRLQRRGSRQQRRQHNKAFVIPNSEFDFEASNAKFDKNEMNQEELDNEASEPEGFYDKKSSFFDNISCESKERNEQNEPRRGRFHEERKLNMETFGQSTAYRNNRGRGRGNHRGGYYRYNNNGGYNNRQQQN